jgi:hypothetical protein
MSAMALLSIFSDCPNVFAEKKESANINKKLFICIGGLLSAIFATNIWFDLSKPAH